MAIASRVQRARTDVCTVLLTYAPRAGLIIEAMQAGVCDFRTRGFEGAMLAEHLLDVVHRCFRSESGASVQPARPTPRGARDPLRDVLIGDSPLMEEARQAVRRALCGATFRS